MNEISGDALEKMITSGNPPLILDIRDAASYEAGHLRGAANARMDTVQQKRAMAARMPRDFDIILVDKDGTGAADKAAEMQRLGFRAGYLEGGIKGWSGDIVKSTQSTEISNDVLWSKIRNDPDGGIFLLDVREPDEFASHAIPGAVNMPLSLLFGAGIQEIPRDKELVTICSHGNRSMMAAFALARNGIEATSLEGGMSMWNQVLDHRTAASCDGCSVIQVEKIGKGCLSYVLLSGGEVLVIDPAYPPEKYREIADDHDASITIVADTHQHADHLSAAQKLASATGARLCFSAREEYDIQGERINDGDVLTVGDTGVKVLHVPGHTAGSMAFVTKNWIFGGDTVFMNGVGRPDLRETAPEFAADLYDTIHQKILKFPGDHIIFPAHRSPDAVPEDGVYKISVDVAGRLPLLGLDRGEFVKRIAGTTVPKPGNHSIIIDANRGRMSVPEQQIPELEMGANRCSTG